MLYVRYSLSVSGTDKKYPFFMTNRNRPQCYSYYVTVIITIQHGHNILIKNQQYCDQNNKLYYKIYSSLLHIIYTLHTSVECGTSLCETCFSFRVNLFLTALKTGM